MTAEDEEFNRIERESRIRMELIRRQFEKPEVVKLREYIHTLEMLVRELGDRLAQLESKK